MVCSRAAVSFTCPCHLESSSAPWDYMWSLGSQWLTDWNPVQFRVSLEEIVIPFAKHIARFPSELPWCLFGLGCGRVRACVRVCPCGDQKSVWSLSHAQSSVVALCLAPFGDSLLTDVSALPLSGLWAHGPASGFCYGCWVFKFRFLCLHGNHFTYRSVFPAPELPCFIPFIFFDLIPPII